MVNHVGLAHRDELAKRGMVFENEGVPDLDQLNKEAQKTRDLETSYEDEYRQISEQEQDAFDPSQLVHDCSAGTEL